MNGPRVGRPGRFPPLPRNSGACSPSRSRPSRLQLVGSGLFPASEKALPHFHPGVALLLDRMDILSSNWAAPNRDKHPPCWEAVTPRAYRREEGNMKTQTPSTSTLKIVI